MSVTFMMNNIQITEEAYIESSGSKPSSLYCRPETELFRTKQYLL